MGELRAAGRLTMFLTPKGVPFFAGTYFPKEAFASDDSRRSRACWTT